MGSSLEVGINAHDRLRGCAGETPRAEAGRIAQGYWKHHRYTGRDLYARFGKQDLTADVNFSDLIGWGEALGWQTLLHTTQREFVAEYHPGFSSASSTRFLKPGNAGDAFQVLDQHPSLSVS